MLWVPIMLKDKRYLVEVYLDFFLLISDFSKGFRFFAFTCRGAIIALLTLQQEGN